MLSLKTQRRKLAAYQSTLESSVARDSDAARALLSTGRRDRALLALRKRNATQLLLQRTDAWLLRLEETLASIDTAARTQTLVATLRSGADVLKAITESVSVSEVEGLLDDTADAQAAAQRLNAALGGSSACDAQAEEELRVLEQQMGALQAAEMPSVPAQAPMLNAKQAPPLREASREEPLLA